MNDTYTIKVSCLNCGYNSTAQKEKGRPIGITDDAECPNCGCDTVSEYKYNEPSLPKEKWREPEKHWMKL